MKTSLLVVALLACLAFPAGAQAAKLQPGNWTGSTTSPAGEEVQIVFEVTSANDTTHLKINTVEHGSFEATDLSLVGDTLRFKFQPGPLVECVLARQADGSFVGSCTAGETAESAAMSMVPPRKE